LRISTIKQQGDKEQGDKRCIRHNFFQKQP